MDNTAQERTGFLQWIKDYTSRPHLGIFFGATLLLVIANTVSLRSAESRFWVLVAELIILPALFMLMGSTHKMWLLGSIIPVAGLAAAMLGRFLGSETMNLRLFAVVQLLVSILLLAALIKVLFRKHKVNFQTVMGAASLYVLFGLLFARLYFAMDVFDSPFFAEAARPIISSDFVYYSFTTMTTIGYGDLTAYTEFGRLLSVVAAIVGQLYLVVVIAAIVGNYSAHFVEHEEREQTKRVEKRKGIRGLMGKDTGEE